MASVIQRLTAGDSEITQSFYGRLVAQGSAYLRERQRLYIKAQGDSVLGVAPRRTTVTEHIVARQLQEAFHRSCAGRADFYVRVLQLVSAVENIPLACMAGDPVYLRGLQEIT